MFHYFRTVHYHETDKMGIAHHSNYIKWMEEARVAFLEDIGMPFQDIEELGVLSPVVKVSVEYKTPCAFGDQLDIRASLVKFSGVRFSVVYEIENISNGNIAAVASSEHCFTKDGRVYSLKKASEAMYDTLMSAIEQ